MDQVNAIFSATGQLQCSCSHLQIVSLTLNAQKSLEKVCLTSTSSTNPPQLLYVHVLRPCCFQGCFPVVHGKLNWTKHPTQASLHDLSLSFCFQRLWYRRCLCTTRSKQIRKKKNYKKHGSHLIFLKIIHNPVPQRHLQYLLIFQGETGDVEAIGVGHRFGPAESCAALNKRLRIGCSSSTGCYLFLRSPRAKPPMQPRKAAAPEKY